MDSKMKKALPYIKSLIFIVGLIVIIGVCDYCFAKTGYIHYILQHVNEDDENYDTIVLGASHARSAIDPAKIDSQADTVTLSMAIPGETLKDSYYVLEESCKNNDVKRVIFDVDYQYWFGPQEEGYFAETFIYNQFSWLSLTKWDYFIHNSEYMDIRSAFTKRYVYCDPTDFSAVKNNIIQKNSEDYKNANIYSLDVKDAKGPYKGQGFFYRDNIEGGPLGEGYVQTWEGRQFTKMQSYPVAYFKKIKEYCDKNGIELICVTSPITPSSVKRLGLDVVNEKFEKFFGELGVTYYNFNKARMDVLPREDNDYADKEGHMEGHLAEEYSQVLGEVIDKHIDGILNMKDYFFDSFEELFKTTEE